MANTVAVMATLDDNNNQYNKRQQQQHQATNGGNTKKSPTPGGAQLCLDVTPWNNATEGKINYLLEKVTA